MEIREETQRVRERAAQVFNEGIATIPLGDLYSAFTSQFGGYYTTDSSAGATSMKLVTMTTTAQVTVPVSTVTVESTILRTSFVTVSMTTDLVQPASSSSSSSFSTSSSRRHTSVAPLASKPASSQLGGLSASGTHTSLPAIVTQSSLSKSPTASTSTSAQTSVAAIPSGTAQPESQTAHVSQKHAIIGGLCGAIAGLVLIGLLLCFWLQRRRRRRSEEDSDYGSMNEKGIRPAIKRKWTELTMKGTPKATPQIPAGSSPITVDEDHHFIRMSTQHWPRPFAAGQGEGFRDSVAPGQLRVMNPDLSRPSTPRMSSVRSDTAASFLKRQRSALAAVLLNANRSRASFRTNVDTPPQIPEITIDPALSQECIAPTAQTPSFRSYPSVTSLPLVSQQPPEDPFLTPPDEKSEEAAEQRPKRPGLTPLQSAAGAASRTLSHIGSVLNPFRAKSGVVETVRSISHQSVSTMSSRFSHRNTAYSDPFDLDRPSIRGSNNGDVRTMYDIERSPRPNGMVYDGT